MFQTRGLIFRKTVVTSRERVYYMSKSMVNLGSSKQGFAEITINVIRRYASIKFIEFKYNSIKKR